MMMTALARWPIIAALGVVLAFQAGPAAANHYFTLQNCTGHRESFKAYDKGDMAYAAATVHKHLENGTSASFHCSSSDRCQVQAGSNTNHVATVGTAITFYSDTTYSLTIDSSCSGAATHATQGASLPAL